MKTHPVPTFHRPLFLAYLALCAVMIALFNAAIYHVTGSPDVTIAANVLVTPTAVGREVARRLLNSLRFTNNVQRGYSDEFAREGGKIGASVNVRLPQRYKVSKGQAITITGVVDNVVAITLTDQANVGLEFSMASLTLDIDDYKKRYINPAIDTLANTVDLDGMTRMTKETFMHVGTPGVVPGSTGTLPQAANQVYLDAGVRLDNMPVPMEGRKAMLSPNMHAYLANANVAIFNPATLLSQVYKTGMFGAEALGVAEWYKTQSVYNHVIGALGGTPVVAGANQTGSSIATSGWTASTAVLNKGDILTFAGVNFVNQQNYQDTTQLSQHVVTANVTSDGSGLATIPIYPPITPTGNFQTVTASPANLAVIKIFGHASAYAGLVSPQGLIYVEDAYAVAFADLEKPGGLWVSERISNKALGISVRFLKDYNIMTDQSPARVDVLYGWKATRPEMGVRIAS